MEEYNEKRSYLKCITAYLIVSLILSTIVLSLINQFIPSDMIDAQKDKILSVSSIYVNLLVNMSLAIIFIVFIKKYLFQDLKKIKQNLIIFLILIITSYGFVFLGEKICAWFYSLFDMSLTSNNQQNIEKMIEINPVVMCISICVFGPFVEEVVFRKCIFGFFKKDRYGLIVSSLAFGLIHVISSLDIVRVLPYLVTGFIFGGIYVLSKRNIYASTIAHIICNTVSFILIVI